MLTTLPLPPVRRFRKRSRAQQAAIELSREAKAIRSAGGGMAVASAVLGPLEVTTSATLEHTHPKLSTCTLCGKHFTSRERKRSVFEGFGLAHERCLMEKFHRYEIQPAIIACELAIRSRLAREIQGRARCR